MSVSGCGISITFERVRLNFAEVLDERAISMESSLEIHTNNETIHADLNLNFHSKSGPPEALH